MLRETGTVVAAQLSFSLLKMTQVDNHDFHITDIRVVEQLTSLTDISRLLHETLATERGLEAELDQLLSRRGDLEQNLLALHAGSREVCVGHVQHATSAGGSKRSILLLQTLEVVKTEAETLANSVKQTSNLSESVSKKVRELDTAQSRVHNTLESIDYIVNRTNAVDGVQQALQSDDYEAAAEYVDALLQSEDKYGKAHQDSHMKQSEQQSRVCIFTLPHIYPQVPVRPENVNADACRGTGNTQNGYSRASAGCHT